MRDHSDWLDADLIPCRSILAVPRAAGRVFAGMRVCCLTLSFSSFLSRTRTNHLHLVDHAVPTEKRDA